MNKSAAIEAQSIWVSEHYWPGVAGELVVAQAQRLAHTPGCVASIVLPSQQTAFGLFHADDPDDVRAALSAVGLTAGAVSPAWQITTQFPSSKPTEKR
jgi:hypothetical protein